MYNNNRDVFNIDSSLTLTVCKRFLFIRVSRVADGCGSNMCAEKKQARIIKNILCLAMLWAWLINGSILFASGGTLTKYIFTKNEPSLIKWTMSLNSLLGIVLSVLGLHGACSPGKTILLVRTMIIAFCIVLWWSVEPLKLLLIASKNSIRDDWGKNQTEQMIKWQQSLHCCGLNGPDDYAADVKIGCVSTFEKIFQDGCLQAASDHYQHYTNDFDMCKYWLLLVIVIDAIVLIIVNNRPRYKLSQCQRMDVDDVTEA